MREKPSEWVAISDLMAGILAVVMLLLVVAVLQKNVSEMQFQQELANAKKNAEDPIKNVGISLQAVLEQSEFSALMSVDLAANRLTLKDGVFERGSACLTNQALRSVEAVRDLLARFLTSNNAARIYVEGYTDNIPVKRPVTDYARFCTVYDDNYTLSAARAREVRKALIGELDEGSSKRIVVAGFGDSKPLDGLEASDSRNRRVEVLFTMQKAGS
ncbi:flagellar motor protein MotB [Rheinheimera sp. MM224]|uniref:OmpA/MotB family protein n=1 Tax=Rheinheimera sp. MM224 TaxID=3019969 RepID=UPI0021F81832|nr:OmpA family protein [Rheinheimera sp. MM224]CAI3798149.1 hypothetical protein JAMGFMIE_01999 [Rheinheimera sp. MM224]